MTPNTAIDLTRRWISSTVIGLNLCPFARRVFEGNKIRYAVTQACDESGLRDELTRELVDLAGTEIEQVETTLLIHPKVLTHFLDYHQFLDSLPRLLKNLGLEGVIQIASFHPDYQFAGTEPDAVENYTNRSPYPMLHLLREQSITNLNLSVDELNAIPRRNIETLRNIRKGARKGAHLLFGRKGSGCGSDPT
jgi:uncharacterized protein